MRADVEVTIHVIAPEVAQINSHRPAAIVASDLSSSIHVHTIGRVAAESLVFTHQRVAFWAI